MVKYYNEAEASLWTQPDGPNTEVQLLHCHDVADIVMPQGDVERSYCVDPATGKFRMGNRRQGPPGAPTTTFTAHVGMNKDWLEHVMSCPTTYYVHKVDCGDRRLFLNYERSWILRYGITTQRTLARMATLMGLTGPAGDSTQAFAISADLVEDVFRLIETRHTTVETLPLRDISGCTSPVCPGYCGPRAEACDDLVAVAEGSAGSTANVLVSHDHGVTWRASTQDPFGVNDMDISTVVCFPVGDGSEKRVLVARGTTDAGPPDVAWSDDWGETAWNEVALGAVGTDYIQWCGGLFSLGHRHTWAVTHQGDIWFSEDGGLSWTEQAPGLNTEELNYIRFVDENVGIAVGTNQRVLYTVDGGAHWNILTGPGAGNLLCCDIFDAHRAWVGDSGGHLWYTERLGVGMVAGDWVERVLPLPVDATAISQIQDVMFQRESAVQTNDHVGFLATRWTDAAVYYGATYRTFNGGKDWELWPTASMAAGLIGLGAVWACGVNEAFAVGDPITTAYIMSVNGALP